MYKNIKYSLIVFIIASIYWYFFTNTAYYTHVPTSKDNNCNSCHQNAILHFSSDEVSTKPISHSNHDFTNSNHGIENFNNFPFQIQKCLKCHKQNQCLNCHRNKPSKHYFSNSNLLFPHKNLLIEKNTNCFNCHKSIRDCQSCHDYKNIKINNMYKEENLLWSILREL